MTALLPNGRVLMVGSANPNGNPVLYSAEVYDPATETWSATAALTVFGSLILLANGRVLAVGGNSAELYDSDTGSWHDAGTLNVVRFAKTATLLQSGKVLVTGFEENGSSAAELYDPETGVWSITGRPTEVRGTATVLSDGRVLLAGGYDSYHPVSGRSCTIRLPKPGVLSHT